MCPNITLKQKWKKPVYTLGGVGFSLTLDINYPWGLISSPPCVSKCKPRWSASVTVFSVPGSFIVPLEYFCERNIATQACWEYSLPSLFYFHPQFVLAMLILTLRSKHSEVTFCYSEVKNYLICASALRVKDLSKSSRGINTKAVRVWSLKELHWNTAREQRGGKAISVIFSLLLANTW